MVLQTINSKEEFDEVLQINQDKIVVVDFYADWCGPCKAIAPKLEPMAKELDVVIVKVNTDDQSDLSENLDITGLPTFIIYKNGTELKRVMGSSETKLKEAIATFSKGC